MLRDYLPLLGTESAISRWRRLRREALSLAVLASLAWAKWIEQNVAFLGGKGHLGMWLAWLGTALLLSAWYVHEKRLERAAEQAAEAADEMTDKLSDLDIDDDEDTRW